MTRPGENPRVAMLAALARVQAARGHLIDGHYPKVVTSLRKAEAELKLGLENYHHERQRELRVGE